MDELKELKLLVRDVVCALDSVKTEIDTLRQETQLGMDFARRVQADMEEIMAGRRPAPLRPMRKRIKRRTSDDWALLALHGLLSERLGIV